MNGGINAEAQLLEIYPHTLILNSTHHSLSQTSFLDFEIRVEDGEFDTKTYDKRDDFNFEIVNFPDLSGNIP